MRTTQKPTDRTGRLWAAVCVVATLSGCTPPEQKALEEGSRLLAERKTAEALVELEKAKVSIENDEILKKEFKITGKLYNQLGLAHQILSRSAKDDNAKNDHSTKALEFYGNTINQNTPPVIKQRAYLNRAWLYFENHNLEDLKKSKEKEEDFRKNAIKAAEDFHRVRSMTGDKFEFWIEKGTVELHAKLYDKASASFKEVSIKSSEANNGLGVINTIESDRARGSARVEKNKTAAMYFEEATKLDKNNVNALLNLAITRQKLKQYDAALEAYRKYLDLVPSGDSDIKDLVDSIEEYLKPEPVPEPEPIPEPEPVAEVESEPKEEAKPEPVVAEVEPAPEPEPAEVVIVEPPAEAPEPEPAAPEPEVTTVVEPAPLPVPAAKPEPTAIQPEPAGPSEPAPEPEVSQAETTPPEPEPAKPAKGWKQRLNPLTWFGGDDEKTAAEPKKKTKPQISWRSNAPVPTTPLPGPGPVAQASTNAVRVASVLPSAVAFPRYKYLNPALPDSGDRRVAKTYFEDGAAAQKSEEWQRAKAAYIEAAKADPAWFDARFELGQAAFYTGDTNLALQSFEHALAINPNDEPARFNFAMSLVQGNYFADAASEFETFLQFDPDNTEAHFEAGKLYAEKLNDVAKANVHYKRVIGLQPGHPQAVTIRYWLIRNKAN